MGKDEKGKGKWRRENREGKMDQLLTGADPA